MTARLDSLRALYDAVKAGTATERAASGGSLSRCSLTGGCPA